MEKQRRLMISGNYLHFINDRIEKLNTAIFYNYSNSLLKFPASIIKVTGSDENGNIWFSVKKPYKDITDFDKEFPAQLKFYNKLYRFYVTVDGKANLIPDKELQSDNAYIRFRIVNASYCSCKKNIKSGFKLQTFINALFTIKRGFRMPHFT